MTFRSAALVAMTTIGLTACMPTPPPAPGPGEACPAEGLQSLVGGPLTAFDQSQFGGPVRVLGPNQPATMDYNGQRLNVFHDGQGHITRISCG